MNLRVKVDELRTPAQVLVRGLEFECAPGTITTLMGPSGCGKSSLLALICGTLAPELQAQAQVWLHGQRIDALRTEARQVGILFQDDLLFPHMTVLENLLFALGAGPRAARLERAHEALAEAELSGYANANPATLSGGQRARVSLMRALLAQPKALLLDEPFSRLDAALRQRVREFVFEHVRERGIPVLLVTHDEADAADPQRVIRLEPPRA
jgi:putative thiamine transport system ATP-binding protein